MSPRIRFKGHAEPETPSAGYIFLYVDIVDNRIKTKDEYGTVRILDTLETAKIENYVSDAAYEAVYFPGIGGMVYFNSTTNNVRLYNGTMWEDLTATLAELQGQTGLISGGEVTLASATTVNIASGKGYIFDYSDPENPVITFVTWDEILNYDLAVVTGSTLLGFGVAGTLTEVPVKTDEAMRTYILVAGVTLMGGNIAAVDDAPRNIGYNAPHSFRDFIHNIIGPANASGNEIAYRGADLTLYNPGGAVYNLGSNQRNDPTEPDVLKVPEGDPLAFFYSVRIAPGAPFYAIGAPGIYVDPDNYDDGSGAPVAVPVGKFTVQQAYITPTGIHALCYGQKLFDTMEDAIDAVSANTLDFEENVPIYDFTRRTYIAMQQGSTVLNDEMYAQFIQDGQFRFAAPTSANLLANIYKWQFDVSAEATIDLHNIQFPKLGTPAYDDLSNFFPAQQSAGVIEGGEITDGGSGSINIADVSFLIKITDSEIGENVFADLAGSNLATIVDERLNFIYVDYNAGTPIFVSTDLSADISFHDQILLGTVYRSGTTLTIDTADKQRSVDASKRLYDIETFANAWVQTGCYSNIDHVVKVGTDTIDLKPGSGWIRKTDGSIIYLSWEGETDIDVSYIGNQIPWVCLVLDPGETFLVREIIQFLPDQDIDSFEGIIVAGRVWYFEGALVASGRHMLFSRDPSVARSAAWTNKAYNVSVGIIASTIDTNYFDIQEGWMYRWPVIEIGTGHHNFLTPGVVKMQTIWGHIIGQDYHDDILDDAGGDEFDITQVANYWDNAGTIEIVPIGKFAVHEIRIYPQSAVRVWVRAQEFFSTLLDAQNSIARQSYELSPWLENMQQCPITAYVLLKRGCTDFTDVAQAYIQINTGAGGGGGSGGASSASPWKTATGGIEYTGGSVAVAPITGNGTFDVWGENSTYNRLLVLSKADDASISFTGTLGDLLIDRDHSGTNVMKIDGSTGALTLTNNGITDFTMHSATGNNRFYMYADDTVGGRVLVNNSGEINIGSLDYASGELILWSGAAEQLVIGTTGLFDFQGNHLINFQANAEFIYMDELEGLKTKSLEFWFDSTQSAGITSGFFISDGGGGTINVSGGTGIFKVAPSTTAHNLVFDFVGETGIVLVDQQANFIYVDYNGGDPFIGISTSVYASDGQTQFVVGMAYRDGTTVSFTQAAQTLYDMTHRQYLRAYEKDGLIRTSGMLCAEAGTYSFTVSSGVWWAAFYRDISPAFNMTTGDTFKAVYRDGSGGWTTIISQTQIDLLHYDDGDGTLGNLKSKEYGINWIYYTMDDVIVVQYGQHVYSSSSDALGENPPETGPLLANYGILIGKVAFDQQGDYFEVINVADRDTYFGSYDASPWNSVSGGIEYDFGYVRIKDNHHWVENTLDGITDPSQQTKGILLTSAGMDATNKLTPGLLFGSTSSVFTTSNPKMLAAIYGRAYETYGDDADGGMGIDFFTSPLNVGVTPFPVLAVSIDYDGTFEARRSAIFNTDAGNFDFRINSLTSGIAYNYNADLYTHRWQGKVVFNDAAQDVDFTIARDGGGEAYRYNAGSVNHAWNGEVFFNLDRVDADFTIRKNGTGDAYKYDAGTDQHIMYSPLTLLGDTNAFLTLNTDSLSDPAPPVDKGIRLISDSMQSVNNYYPGIFWMSTDGSLGVNKNLAAIMVHGDGYYSANDDGATTMEFYTTPSVNAVGEVTPWLKRLELDHNGHFDFNPDYNAGADFIIRKETSGNAYQWASDTNTHAYSGTVVFNNDFDDADFIVQKETSGNALFYDAGNDQWKQNGSIFFNYDHLDKDFYIYKNLSGTAFGYDAGTDKLHLYSKMGSTIDMDDHAINNCNNMYMTDGSTIYAGHIQGNTMTIWGRGSGTTAGLTLTNRDNGNTQNRLELFGNNYINLRCGNEAGPQYPMVVRGTGNILNGLTGYYVAFNNDNQDMDFRIKGTTNTAFAYDAGDDEFSIQSHTIIYDHLSIWRGDTCLKIGADRYATTRTDNTDKYGGVSLAHYTNAEEGLGLISALSSGSSNIIEIGGGTIVASNAATEIIFRTASNTTTLEGTERLKIDDTEIVCNDGSNDFDFRVAGSTQTHALFVDATNNRVGLGKSAPTENLHVDYNAKVEGQIIGNVSTAQSTTAPDQWIYPNFNQGNVARIHLNHDFKLGSPYNTKPGATYYIAIKQHGSGGPHDMVDIGSDYYTESGGTPDLGNTINDWDLLTFVCVEDGILLEAGHRTNLHP